MSKGTIATIERVTHRYGKTFALDNLSLDIPAHCMVGMIGPDGVGKSTLLALISGVRKIQSGKIMVLDGNMADEHHRHARPRLRITRQRRGDGTDLRDAAGDAVAVGGRQRLHRIDDHQ